MSIVITSLIRSSLASLLRLIYSMRPESELNSIGLVVSAFEDAPCFFKICKNLVFFSSSEAPARIAAKSSFAELDVSAWRRTSFTSSSVTALPPRKFCIFFLIASSLLFFLVTKSATSSSSSSLTTSSK